MSMSLENLNSTISGISLTTKFQITSESSNLIQSLSSNYFSNLTSSGWVSTGQYESVTNNNLLLMTSLSSVYENQTLTTNFTNATWSPEVCVEELELFRTEYNLVFDYKARVRVLVTWIVFLMSAIGNSFVLTSVTIRRRRRHISHPQLMMMHLTFANLAFTFFILPADAIWNTTMEWYGGDILCRLVNVLKQFAMYISSAMIVVMGIDRVTSLMCPMSLAGQRQRITTMLAVAWIFSLLNAIPAGVIFSVITHPHDPIRCPESVITQCVDLKVSEQANLDAYYVYTMFVSFFGPLICILICYLFIALSISRMARISKEAQKRCALRQRGSNKSVTRRGLDRARRISQIVTGLITATFILCWGPYYVVGLIQWFEQKKKGPDNTSVAHVFMLMSMYLNPMLHPLITLLLMKEVRDNVITQCRKHPDSINRKPISNKKPPVANVGNNGTAELLPKANGGSNRTQRQWV